MMKPNEQLGTKPTEHAEPSVRLEEMKIEWKASGKRCIACEEQVVNKSHHYDCPVRKFYRLRTLPKPDSAQGEAKPRKRHRVNTPDDVSTGGICWEDYPEAKPSPAQGEAKQCVHCGFPLDRFGAHDRSVPEFDRIEAEKRPCWNGGYANVNPSPAPQEPSAKWCYCDHGECICQQPGFICKMVQVPALREERPELPPTVTINNTLCFTCMQFHGARPCAVALANKVDALEAELAKVREGRERRLPVQDFDYIWSNGAKWVLKLQVDNRIKELEAELASLRAKTL